MELIHKLANPAGLTVGDKLSGGVMVAVVGMTITFLALIFLWLAIEVMAKLLNQNKPKKESAAAPAAKPAATASPAQPAEQDDSELVSVITAAVATAMNTSINNIVVSKIVRVSDERPAWSRIGLIEQMNNRF